MLWTCSGLKPQQLQVHKESVRAPCPLCASPLCFLHELEGGLQVGSALQRQEQQDQLCVGIPGRGDDGVGCGSSSSRCWEGRLQDIFLCNNSNPAARSFCSVRVLPKEDPCPVVWGWFGSQNSAPEVSCCRMFL